MRIHFQTLFHTEHSPTNGAMESHEYMHPVRDWMIVLGVCVLVFVGGAAYSAYDFYMQFGAPSEETSVAEKDVHYRDAEVKALSETYAQKESAFMTLRAARKVDSVSMTDSGQGTGQASSSAQNIPPLANEGTPRYTDGAPILSP